MDDFEYSVQISDQDWNGFFQECEECNLVPPALARADDSGMSDIDDRGSIIADRALKSDLTPGGFLEADYPIDGPPDCEGSPVDHYHSEYSIGGIHNVLSGSEEDIHLESVNSFFERLRSLAQAERPIELSQVGAGKTREPVQKEEFYRDGPPANDSALPANIPELNSLPARCGTAMEKEATEATHANINTNTSKKDEPCSEITLDAAASKSLRETKTSAHPELFIREEDWVVTTDTELRGQSQPHESSDVIVCSEKTPDSDKTLSSETDMCKPYVEHGDFLMDLTLLHKNLNMELPSSLDVIVEDELERAKNRYVLFPEPEPRSPNNGAGQEWSPTASVKKKRRRKKRISIELVESGRRYEKEFSADWSDSEGEPSAWRRGMDPHSSQGKNVKRTEKTDSSFASLTMYSEVSHKTTNGHLLQQMTPTGNHANPISPTPPLIDCRCQSLPERLNISGSQMLANTLISGVSCKTTDLRNDKKSMDKSSSQSGQTDDSIMSTINKDDNAVPHLQPCNALQLQQTAGLNVSPLLSVTVTSGATGESDLTKEMQKRDSESLWICEGEADAAGHLQESDNMNHSFTNGGRESKKNPNLYTAKGASVIPSVSLGRQSSHVAFEANQNDKVSTIKVCLAPEVHFDRDNHTLCPNEAEPPQQLEIDYYNSVQPCPTFEKANSSLSAVVMTDPDLQEMSVQKHKQSKTRPSSVHFENQNQVASVNSALETSSSSPVNSCGSKSLSYVNVNNTAQQQKYHENGQTISKLDGFSEEDTVTERAESAAPHAMVAHSPSQSGESNYSPENIKKDNSRLSVSEDVLKGQSIISPNINCSTSEESQSCQSLSKEPATSHSNENTTNIMNSPSSTVSPNCFSYQQEERSQIPLTDGKEDIPEPEREIIACEISGEKCDLESKPTSEAEKNKIQNVPDSKTSVFAMSSFWSEMEKLTIKDILVLRMVNNSPTPVSLSPLIEVEVDDTSEVTDSGYFTHLDDLKPDLSDGHLSSVSSGSVETRLNPDTIMTCGACKSGDVLWERDSNLVSIGAGIYPENIMLISNTPQSLLSSSSTSSAQKHFGKMSKNVSVHNLHALGLDCEPLNSMWKGQTLPRVNSEQELEDSFTDGNLSRRDSGMDSLTSSSVTEDMSAESYRISLTNIFQYIFGGKQSKPSPPETDYLTTHYTDGNSVPEMYDHFFSEFDSGSFFYSLIEAGDQPKNEPVPIFYCSRSTNRNLQFPEAYDHFFSSSSSDDSSIESDEEGSEKDCNPIRVVTRFSRKANETCICTDIYDNFFTDRDIMQNFFWKNTFSLRNVDIAGSVRQKQESNPLTLTSVNKSIQTPKRTIQPISALGNQDIPFPDPLLYNLEDRISKQLAGQLYRFDDLQTSVLNPRLGASLVPLRQSDMCLVCIAFASWVLKSANPQVGDAWKAVLLANVSALSAIRYLRKYARVGAAAQERSAEHSAHV